MKPFIKVEKTFFLHPKFEDLSNAATGLWLKCASWCGDRLTDGVIPASTVRKQFDGTPAQVRALVNAGLWHECETEDGRKAYLFHDWLDYQESRETVEGKRTEASQQRKDRRKRQAESAGVSTGSSAKSSNSTDVLDKNVENRTSQNTLTSGNEEVSAHRDRDRDRDQTRSDERETARPPGGALTPTETEEKIRDEGEETQSSPILSDPRFSPASLESRLSALQGECRVVDVSETKTSWTPRTAREQADYLLAQKKSDGPTRVQTATSDPRDKSLEDMNPAELLDYIETYQREVNGIELTPGGAPGVTTMKGFQRRYGNKRAAAIIQELFVNGDGYHKVAKEVEMITFRHFSEQLDWFTGKIDVNLQAKAKSEADVERDYVFASEL